MAFLETPRFPERISYGAIGGPEYKTSILTVQSGDEQRNIEWEDARGRWDVSQAVQNEADFKSVATFFRATKGRGHGFRFKDFADYEASVTEGILGTGVGTGTPTFQMNKKYVAGALSETRMIQKPVSGTCTFKRNAATLVEGAGAGQISVNYTTGIVTFVADASSAASSVTVGATTQVVLASNPGSLVASQKLYLSGFAGADAALLNGLAHTITNVSGSGPYTFTLSTNTAGKTITLGSGLGAKYPQTSEALTWSGEFDVPARFDTDRLQAELVGPGSLMQWKSIPIIEIRVRP